MILRQPWFRYVKGFRISLKIVAGRVVERKHDFGGSWKPRDRYPTFCPRRVLVLSAIQHPRIFGVGPADDPPPAMGSVLVCAPKTKGGLVRLSAPALRPASALVGLCSSRLSRQPQITECFHDLHPSPPRHYATQQPLHLPTTIRSSTSPRYRIYQNRTLPVRIFCGSHSRRISPW